MFRDREISFPLLASLVRRKLGSDGLVARLAFWKTPGENEPVGGCSTSDRMLRPRISRSGIEPGRVSLRRPDGQPRATGAEDVREEAIRLASGQEWVGTCAFVCIMTTVAARSFWKYPASIGYRAMLLDAGHLGQHSPCWRPPSRLGLFTTGAIQQSRIERLLGLDGVTEFPIYLCGAGIPSTPRLSLRRPFKPEDPRGVLSAGKRHRPVNDKRDRR